MASITRGVVVCTSLAVLLAPPAAFAVPANDSRSNPRDIPVNVALFADNTDATYSNAEDRFEWNSGESCPDTGKQMVSTVWFRVTGTGGTMTVSTYGFDTMVAVSGAGADGRCDDDSGGNSGSRLSFPTAAGASYLIQVGSYYNSVDNLWDEGQFTIVVLANDDSAHAETITAPSQFDRSSTGATGAANTCNGVAYANAVWFRYVVPELGHASFHVSGFPLGVAIFRGSEQLACQASATSNSAGATARNVRAGDVLLVRVGGVPDLTGNFILHTAFERNCDGDGDGEADANRGTCAGGTDCDDANGGIKRGIAETVNNGVDENCDGYRHFDRDGDGHPISEPSRDPAIPDTEWDCNDTPPLGSRIHPGAHDVRGNRLNEDCKGRPAPVALIRTNIGITYQPVGLRVKPSSLALTRLARGMRVVASCTARGCPRRPVRRRIRRRTAKLSLLGAFREARLGPGDRLTVKVFPPSTEFIGKVRTDIVGAGNRIRLPVKTCITFRGRPTKKRCRW